MRLLTPLFFLIAVALADKSPQEVIDYIYHLQQKRILPDAIVSKIPASSKNLFSPMRVMPLESAQIVSGRRHTECEVPHELAHDLAAAYFPFVGDHKANDMECSWGNQFIYGGGGDDTIRDHWGNDFIYPGSGNDTVDAGWGSDVILYFPGWGHDSLDKTCHESTYFRKPEDTGPSNLSYRWEKTNFLIFGGGISERDIFIDGDVIRNVKTGDTITTNHLDTQNCFNFIFTGD